MDPDLVAAGIIASTLAATLCGTSLMAWRMWLKSKSDRLKLADQSDVERLVETVDALHDRIQFMHEEMGELHERVDFAERLLAKGNEPAEPYKPDPLVAT